jgi:hypothetical protein
MAVITEFVARTEKSRLVRLDQMLMIAKYLQNIRVEREGRRRSRATVWDMTCSVDATETPVKWPDLRAVLIPRPAKCGELKPRSDGVTLFTVTLRTLYCAKPSGSAGTIDYRDVPWI